MKPGAELAAAADEAEDRGIEVRLVDREIKTTLIRAWRKAGFWNKMKLLATLLGSLFEDQKLDEEELAKLRQTDTLSVMLEEIRITSYNVCYTKLLRDRSEGAPRLE